MLGNRSVAVKKEWLMSYVADLRKIVSTFEVMKSPCIGVLKYSVKETTYFSINFYKTFIESVRDRTILVNRWPPMG